MEASLSLSAAKDIKEPSLVMILQQSISIIVYEHKSQIIYRAALIPLWSDCRNTWDITLGLSIIYKKVEQGKRREINKNTLQKISLSNSPPGDLIHWLFMISWKDNANTNV